MSGMLELGDQEFKATMLRALKEKADNMGEQMANISREKEIL